ncbi:MAG: hypothetical protein DHS20C08_20260 [Rhodomicrobium sp.]|nr:MAG: hypothetical protein DHS20C08_20260 [Rhodomicrobium sp.]
MTFRIHGEETVLNAEALSYIIDAWEEAIIAGLEPETIAGASLFAALTDLVSSYGEDAVSTMIKDLSIRISNGEFSLDRVTQ